MPGYELRISASARRSLGRIPLTYAWAVVELLLGDLAEEPHRVGKPLHNELAGLFAARRGPYRIVYRVDDEAHTVDVERIDHRADVYRPG